MIKCMHWEAHEEDEKMKSRATENPRQLCCSENSKIQVLIMKTERRSICAIESKAREGNERDASGL